MVENEKKYVASYGFLFFYFVVIGLTMFKNYKRKKNWI